MVGALELLNYTSIVLENIRLDSILLENYFAVRDFKQLLQIQPEGGKRGIWIRAGKREKHCPLQRPLAARVCLRLYLRPPLQPDLLLGRLKT